MSESRRAAWRIISNYVRLFATVVLGLLLVRILLKTLGADAVGLIALLASTISVSGVIEEAMEASTIRELGRAHHLGDRTAFRRLYNSALVVSALAGAATLVIFAVVFGILPLLSINDDLMIAARWLVVAKAVESIVVVVLAPAYNMYLVLERMVQANWWLFARRSCHIAAAIPLMFIGFETIADGLILYAWLTTALHILVLAVAVAMLLVRDRRLVPALHLADRTACSEILRTSGANASKYLAALLQIPAGALLMNLWFGLHGNLIFSIAVQLSGYARMLTIGLTTGIDAVGTRLATQAEIGGGESRMQALVYHATRLQSFVAIPAIAGMFVIADSFLHVWIANAGVTQAALEQTATLARILLVGMWGQSMLDVWWRVFYSAGHVGRFVRPYVVASVLNLVLAVVLLALLRKDDAYVGPSLAFASVNVALVGFVSLRMIPRIFGVGRRRLFAAMLRPVLPACIAAIVMLAMDRVVQPPTLAWLLAEGAVFSVLLAILAPALVFESLDWVRLRALLRQFRNRPAAFSDEIASAKSIARTADKDGA